MEFLMRDDVNLSAEQWQSIDSAVIQAARNVLVGRKFFQGIETDQSMISL